MTNLSEQMKNKLESHVKAKRLQEIMESANNVLEHIFNMHTKCDIS